MKLAGIAINPKTDISALNYVINMADVVHVMTVHPGDYGGKFLPEVASKIVNIRVKRPLLPISVDGGINPENSKILIDAGATVLIVGSYILNDSNPKEAYERF